MRALTRQDTNQPLAVLLHRLNPVLRGWTNYFRHGVSKATFDYLRAFTWRRVVSWLRRKHPRANWKWLRRRYLPGWWPTDGEVTLFNPARGGGHPLPLPGSTHPHAVDEQHAMITKEPADMSSWRAGCVGTRTSGSEGGPGKRTARKAGTAPRPDPYEVLGPAGGRLRRPSSAGNDATVTVGPASPSTPTRARAEHGCPRCWSGALWPCRSWLCLGVRGGDDLGGHVDELA